MEPTTDDVVTGSEPGELGTTIVCLDCPGDGAAITKTHLTKATADGWVRGHLRANPDHRALTVPGWPPPRDVVILAHAHVEATRVGMPGDDQCSTQLADGERCSLRAGHLGGCA